MSHSLYPQCRRPHDSEKWPPAVTLDIQEGFMEMSADISDPRVVESTETQAHPRLLVIDHQPAFTGFARLVAQRLGYDVSVLADPRDVTASIDTYRPNVLMLEIVMPELDGIEVINILAQKGFDGHLILVTGHEPAYADLAKKTAEAKSLKVVAALTKPVRQATMETTLRGIRDLDEC